MHTLHDIPTTCFASELNDLYLETGVPVDLAIEVGGKVYELAKFTPVAPPGETYFCLSGLAVAIRGIAGDDLCELLNDRQAISTVLPCRVDGPTFAGDYAQRFLTLSPRRARARLYGYETLTCYLPVAAKLSGHCQIKGDARYLEPSRLTLYDGVWRLMTDSRPSWVGWWSQSVQFFHDFNGVLKSYFAAYPDAEALVTLRLDVTPVSPTVAPYTLVQEYLVSERHSHGVDLQYTNAFGAEARLSVAGLKRTAKVSYEQATVAGLHTSILADDYEEWEAYSPALTDDEVDQWCDLLAASAARIILEQRDSTISGGANQRSVDVAITGGECVKDNSPAALHRCKVTLRTQRPRPASLTIPY